MAKPKGKRALEAYWTDGAFLGRYNPMDNWTHTNLKAFIRTFEKCSGSKPDFRFSESGDFKPCMESEYTISCPMGDVTMKVLLVDGFSHRGRGTYMVKFEASAYAGSEKAPVHIGYKDKIGRLLESVMGTEDSRLRKCSKKK